MKKDRDFNPAYEFTAFDTRATTLRLLMDIAAKQEVMWNILMKMRCEQTGEMESEYMERMMELVNKIKAAQIDELPKVLKNE